MALGFIIGIQGQGVQVVSGFSNTATLSELYWFTRPGRSASDPGTTTGYQDLGEETWIDAGAWNTTARGLVAGRDEELNDLGVRGAGDLDSEPTRGLGSAKISLML